jgi:lysophospholipase L1-like esterase
MKSLPTLLLRAVALALGAGFLAGATPPPGKAPFTIVAFGDSTTAPRGALPVYADCLRQDLPRHGLPVRVINAGVGGNTTEAGRARFVRDVLDRKPDLVILQFGINDAAVDVWKTPPASQPRVSLERYVANLEFFIESLQAQQRSVLLMTPNALCWTPALKQRYGKAPYRPDAVDGFNVLLQAYAEAARVVAKRKGVPLIDVYAAFQRHGKTPGQAIDDLLLDGMHPNSQGQRLVADLLLPEILKLRSAGER